MRFLTPLLLLLAGCAFGPVDPDPAETENPLSMDLIRGPVTLEMMSINGHAVPAKALAATLATVRRHVVSELTVKAGAQLEVAVDDDGFVLDTVLIEIINARTVTGPGSVTVVALPKMRRHNRGFAANLNDGGHLIVLYGSVLGSNWSWKMVFTHEFGHTLGIPWKKRHKWSANHCTYPTCIMYPRPDFRAIWSAIVNLGAYDDYCKTCASELKAAWVSTTEE